MKIPASIRWKSTGRTLGQGGQAAVVEVTDAENEFPGVFALKALSRGKPAKAYERFAREIDVVRSINHQLIIRVVDHSSLEAKFPFYVMQLHEGATTLKRLLGSDDNPYFRNPLKALSLLTQLLSAIAACEQRDIVHRDLSREDLNLQPSAPEAEDTIA